MTVSFTLRLPVGMRARWQRRADGQGIDLAELIRRTMNGQRTRPSSAIRREDMRHLSRMALWSVQLLGELDHLVERSALDAEQATELQVSLRTLLELFEAVANGEVTEELLPPPADESIDTRPYTDHVPPPA